MTLETVAQRLSGLFALAVLAVLLIGIWRGRQRQAGRTTGGQRGWLLSGWTILAATVLFLGLSWLGWTPLPWKVSPAGRLWMLALGVLLYGPGLVLLLWGRLALGSNYFVSTSLSARLFADHQLVTTGPYAFIRHPMYAGLLLAAWGSMLIFATWTTAAFAVLAPVVLLRARPEEAALAEEFGERWRAYCRRVPAFIPRLRRGPQQR